MKKSFFSFLIILCLQTEAQIQVYNRSLKDSTLPYFYIGVDNALEIDWKGLKPEEHSISISGGGGSITKYSESRFVVRTTTVTDECYIRISNKKGKILFKQPYNVRAIEYSQLSLGGIESGITTTKEKILSNPFLVIDCKGCYYKLRIQIVSFVLTVDINEHIAEAPGTGNQLTEKQIELIKKADDLLTIDNIRAVSPDGRNVKLPSLVIYIKKDEL